MKSKVAIMMAVSFISPLCMAVTLNSKVSDYIESLKLNSRTKKFIVQYSEAIQRMATEKFKNANAEAKKLEISYEQSIACLEKMKNEVAVSKATGNITTLTLDSPEKKKNYYKFDRIRAELVNKSDELDTLLMNPNCN